MPKAYVYRHPGKFLGASEADMRAGGKPCLRGTGVSTVHVYDRWLAGETEDDMANDYDVDARVIVAAVHWELGRRRMSKEARDSLLAEGLRETEERET